MQSWKFVIIILLVCSCRFTEEKLDQNPEGYSIIDLTEVEYSNVSPKLSEFADSIFYIRLDEEPLISDIWDVGIIVTDDAMFADGKQIYKYTFDGKFLLSLYMKGNGPGEADKYPFHRGAYNFERKYVTFSNILGLYYNSYSFDGKFLGFQNKLKDEDPDDKFDVNNNKGIKIICGYLDNMQVYAYDYKNESRKTGDKLNPHGPVLLYAKDLNTDSVVYKLPNYHFDIKATYQNAMAKPTGYPLDYGNIDSIYWVKSVVQDTIYRTSDFKSVRPWYVFKLKKNAANYSHKVHLTLLDMDENEWNKESLQNAYALENGVLFEYGTATTSGVGYCKAGGKAKVISRYFENDLDGYLKDLSFQGLGRHKISQKDGYLYTLVNAEEFLKEGAKSPFPDLTEESNPVVVKLKLKK